MKNKMLASIIILSLVVIMLTAMPKSNAQPDAVVHVAPTVISDALVGKSYTVDINITDAADLYGWEFQLSYDPTILSATSTSIVTGGLNTPTITYQSETNNSIGLIWWAVSTANPTTTGITYPEHAIFEIVFQTKTTGTSNLHLSGTILIDSTGALISHTDADGTITVGTRDLTVASITVDNLGCQIYKDDTTSTGGTYYYPVEVQIQNTGTLDAGSFYVELDIYAYNGSLTEATQEILVADGLGAGSSGTVNFTSLFHPTKTGMYKLTATVDSQNNITEDNKTNNVLILDNIPVTVMGDINGDGHVNIQDAVKISLAFNTTPGNPQWNIKADLNHDGTVNILDAIRIGLHWGETS